MSCYFAINIFLYRKFTSHFLIRQTAIYILYNKNIAKKNTTQTRNYTRNIAILQFKRAFLMVMQMRSELALREKSYIYITLNCHELFWPNPNNVQPSTQMGRRYKDKHKRPREDHNSKYERKIQIHTILPTKVLYSVIRI